MEHQNKTRFRDIINAKMLKATLSRVDFQSERNTQYVFLLRLLTFCVMISRE